MPASLSEALRETIRVQDGRVPLLDRHLARLRAGGCDDATIERARADTLRAAESWPDAYGRMSLVVAVDGSVCAEVTAHPSTIDIPGGPLIALVESDKPHLPPGAAKPADRSFWDRALGEAHAMGADVAVLVSREGFAIDTSQATLWVRTGDRLLTPPSPPALAGVSRSVVFDVAESLGFLAEEAMLSVADLDAAEEVILTTAVAGAVAVRDRGGAATERLEEVFARLFAGEGLPGQGLRLFLGDLVAPRDVEAWRIAGTIDSGREPLVLAPSNETGWFGGTALVCVDPVWGGGGLGIGEAAAVLEAVMRGDEPVVAAAVVSYEGEVRVRIYRSGFARTADGWRTWGCVPVDAPALVLGTEPGFGAATTDGFGSPVQREPVPPVLSPNFFDIEEVGYGVKVASVREAILGGDVYVLNLTMRLTGTPSAGPAETFERLVRSSAGPMSALWIDGERSIVSVSPERFLSVTQDADGRYAEVWPIKGTRPRHTDPARDAALADELAASDKERAEHIMIVDMERNDLGRVCEAGSIRVDPLLEVFATPYCHQLVSRVTGRLRPDTTVAELLEATFPCGSVTGAPKVAAMRLIEELESSSRGVYTGSLLVAMPGRLDSSVLIRTLEYEGASATWGTGGGITIDSDPAEEWREALLKTWPVTRPARL